MDHQRITAEKAQRLAGQPRGGVAGGDGDYEIQGGGHGLELVIRLGGLLHDSQQTPQQPAIVIPAKAGIKGLCFLLLEVTGSPPLPRPRFMVGLPGCCTWGFKSHLSLDTTHQLPHRRLWVGLEYPTR